MKKYTLIITSLLFGLASMAQTVEISGNVQTDIDGDQSGIKVKYTAQIASGFTYTSTVDSVTTDLNGDYSFSFDLNKNNTGLGPNYWPALINIVMSKDGFDSETISNYSTTDPGIFTIDRKLLFTSGATIYTPSICMVRVDTATNYNNIVWEREDNLGIDKYYVYKLVGNTWQQYNDFAFTDLSVCEDFNTDLNSSEFYQIQAVFSNGKKSAYSSALKAPHVTVRTVNGIPNIEWLNPNDLTKLDPTKISSIKIFRGIKKDEMEVLKTFSIQDLIAAPSLSYIMNDLDIAQGGVFYYQVGYEMISDCAPEDLKVESGPFSLAMSNIAESENIPATETNINRLENNINVSVLGNELILQSKNAITYTISNIQGIIEDEGICQNKKSIILKSGIYFISTDNLTQKIIIP